MTRGAIIDWCYDPDLLRPLVGADTDYQSTLAEIHRWEPGATVAYRQGRAVLLLRGQIVALASAQPDPLDVLRALYEDLTDRAEAEPARRAA